MAALSLLFLSPTDLAYPPAHNENSSAPISQGENLMDITKIFSLLQPDEEEDTNTGEKQALNQAVYNNDSYTLDQLLCQERYKRFINSRSGWGVPGTPLRLAAAYGHLSCLQVLLAHGADVDSLDVKAQTPLFTAVSHGHLDCVRVLLEAGACPGGSIYNNCSPVLTAARKDRIMNGLLQTRVRATAWIQPQIPGSALLSLVELCF